MTLTESLSNVCPQFPSRLPRWPALAGLECVWQLAAAGGCAGVLAAWRPPINWWCGVGVAETRHWPRPHHQHRDQQEVVRTHWHNNPRPQHRWGRTASDWILFQAFQCLCMHSMRCGGVFVKKGPVTWNVSHFDRSLERYHGYINVLTQWPQIH